MLHGLRRVSRPRRRRSLPDGRIVIDSSLSSTRRRSLLRASRSQERFDQFLGAIELIKPGEVPRIGQYLHPAMRH
jgi:hypothetical protein